MSDQQPNDPLHGITLEMILTQLAEHYGWDEMGSRRQLVSGIRAKIAYHSREELGLSAAEIARHTRVSTSGMTRAIEKVVKE